mmetsp:Transcript_60258/g.168264  ORF Transcript_60258/g.168264 Transcript_60258/m.168264 type:complete len:126 (+) Transcript_60258:802-1179(+)
MKRCSLGDRDRMGVVRRAQPPSGAIGREPPHHTDAEGAEEDDDAEGRVTNCAVGKELARPSMGWGHTQGAANRRPPPFGLMQRTAGLMLRGAETGNAIGIGCICDHSELWLCNGTGGTTGSTPGK